MRTIKVRHNQTLLDIALQEYGDVEGVYYLVDDNTLDGMIDTLRVGQELMVRESVINRRMVDYLASHTIATAEGSRGEGIGFWLVEKDFVIS